MKKEASKESDSPVIEGAVSLLSVLETSSRKVEKIFIAEGKASSGDSNILKIKAFSEARSIPLEYCSGDFISENTIGKTHGGIIAFVGEKKMVPVEMLFQNKNGFIAMLDGIEDPYNFGYALRSLYAAGADGIVLNKRNWLSAAGVCIRASAGASENIQTAVIPDDIGSFIKTVKENGYKVICAAENGSVSLYDANLERPLLLIIGGEKRGISSELMKASDENIVIKYGRAFGMSLTTAASAAVIGFEVLRQNKYKIK